jgi:DNA topoisomerase-6 subunit B
VIATNWKNYGLQQPRGALPIGPMVVFVHIASVWVPFTSESKEAIASYDEILEGAALGLMECGRKLGTHVRKGKKLATSSRSATTSRCTSRTSVDRAEGHPRCSTSPP